MKKLLFALMAFPAISFAQPAINHTPLPFGDTMNVYLYQHALDSFAISGHNDWDFSYIPESSYTAVATFCHLEPESTPYGAEFPTANTCYYTHMVTDIIEFKAYQYALHETDSTWTLGIRYQDAPPLFVDETYENPWVTFHYPFNYGETQTDIYKAVDEDADSTQTKYIGWGSLKTPFDTFDNVVLLLYSTFDTTEKEWVPDHYMWLSLDDLSYVFSIDIDGDDDPEDDLFMGEIHQRPSTPPSNLIDQEELKKAIDLTVYPNPAKDISYISFNLKDVAQLDIQLFSVDGKISKNIQTGEMQAGAYQVPIYAQELPAGVYFIRVTVDQKHTVTTLVIE